MADQSFSDIRQSVRDALASVDKDKGDDLAVVDLGPDWVVYQDPDTVGAGLYRRGYKIEGGKVSFTSDPVKVTRTTSYEPVSDEKPAAEQPKNLKDAGQEAKRQLKGRKSGDADKSGY